MIFKRLLGNKILQVRTVDKARDLTWLWGYGEVNIFVFMVPKFVNKAHCMFQSKYLNDCIICNIQWQIWNKSKNTHRLCRITFFNFHIEQLFTLWFQRNYTNYGNRSHGCNTRKSFKNLAVDSVKLWKVHGETICGFKNFRNFKKILSNEFTLLTDFLWKSVW